ncbi:hypothetical protein [Streptomyces sp. NBC_01089]|uniref:hypothetical protein n=1 Tax=Streptomyces sp. NBC_01089 TaxID=2903747 RepID=UPI0038677F07|nr:hypothetical protein OG510_16680 [Streptomyces sp. NBC_01089]
MNNMVREVRSLTAVTTLYRMVASLTAIAAVVGVRHGGSPLGGMAYVCDALAIPAGWTGPVESWLVNRTELVGFPAVILCAMGVLALPKRRNMGRDYTQTLEWRAPSTVVLSFAVAVQCGYAWPLLPVVGLLSALGLWEIRQRDSFGDMSEHVVVPVMGIFLAVVFAPLYVVVWLFARDSQRSARP